MRKLFSALLLALSTASVAPAQSIPLLPRVTPTTGLADSSLYLCTDSTKTLTRACKFSDIQKRLPFKPWDSVVTTSIRLPGTLNLTGGSITGSPTATLGAITVSSCTGCGGGGPSTQLTSTWTRDTTVVAVTGVSTWTTGCWADSLNLFVIASTQAVANGIATSPDGTTWTGRTTATTSARNSCVWASRAGQIVIVGTSGLVLTSPDGATWTSRSAAAANTWQQVAYAPALGDSSKGRLVAVASTGTRRIMYSDNGGVNWSLADSTNASLAFASVVYADSIGMFFAPLTAGSSGTGNVFRSVDGKTWTADSIGPAASDLVATMAWSPQLKRVIASTASVVATDWRSSDGLHWAPGTMSTQGAWISWVCGNRFLKIATTDAEVSSDGITWATIQRPKTLTLRPIAGSTRVVGPVGGITGNRTNVLYFDC